VALSANPEYSDSGKSNTLSINTSLHSPREGEALDEMTYTDDHDIPVKVTKVSETSIHLDWSNFLETDGIGCYKIQWSSVAQPAVCFYFFLCLFLCLLSGIISEQASNRHSRD
jgi:hypothetical protein